MIHNIHERTIAAPATELGPLLDGLGRPGDLLWPSDRWDPMVLDRPLAVGADGGHGPIRYTVAEYEPGRRVRFVFREVTGIAGFHELSIEELPGGTSRMRHLLHGQARGRMRLLFPVLVEALHDAVVEDLLDNAERQTTGTVRRCGRRTWRSRLWSRLERQRGR